MTQSIWINGVASDSVSALDRAFNYGDGVFETIRVEQGKSLLLQQHVARMQRGLETLGFDLDVVDALLADVEILPLAGNQVMKWLVSRGESTRGYAVPEQASPTRMIVLAPLSDFSSQQAAGVKARFCDFRLGTNPALSGIKHLNRLEQVMARREWNDASIAEGLVCDLDGYLVEGTMSNLFWVKDKVVFTPEINRCGVQGVMRDYLLSLLDKHEVAYKEGCFTPEDLITADEVFLTNSIIEIWPVTQLQQHRFAVGQTTLALQKWIEQDKC